MLGLGSPRKPRAERSPCDHLDHHGDGCRELEGRPRECEQQKEGQQKVMLRTCLLRKEIGVLILLGTL